MSLRPLRTTRRLIRTRRLSDTTPTHRRSTLDPLDPLIRRTTTHRYPTKMKITKILPRLEWPNQLSRAVLSRLPTLRRKVATVLCHCSQQRHPKQLRVSLLGPTKEAGRLCFLTTAT